MKKFLRRATRKSLKNYTTFVESERNKRDSISRTEPKSKTNHKRSDRMTDELFQQNVLLWNYYIRRVLMNWKRLSERMKNSFDEDNFVGGSVAERTSDLMMSFRIICFVFQFFGIPPNCLLILSLNNK